MQTNEAVIEEIRQTIEKHPVVIFMKGSPETPRCGFSATATEILKQFPYPFKGVDILERQDIREILPDFSQWPTFPQIFIKSEFIGGSDILTQLYRTGELEKKLIAAHPQGGLQKD